MATVVCHLAHQRGGPAICHQLLWDPGIGSLGPTEAVEAHAHGYLLENDLMTWPMRNYLTSPDVMTDPRVQPIRIADLGHMPPTFLMTAGFDPRRDDNRLHAVFGNKEGLFNAAIERYMSGGVGRIILDAPLDGPVARLLARVFAQIVEQGATSARPRGCMITNTAVEMAEERGPASARAAAKMLEIEADLHARIRRGQTRGEIACDMDARAAARIVLNNMHGLRVMAKLLAQRETLQDTAGCVPACFAAPGAFYTNLVPEANAIELSEHSHGRAGGPSCGTCCRSS